MFFRLELHRQMVPRVGLAPTLNSLTKRRATLTLPGNEIGMRGRYRTHMGQFWRLLHYLSATRIKARSALQHC